MVTLIVVVVAFVVGVIVALRAKAKVEQILTVIHGDLTSRLDALEAKIEGKK